MLTVGILGRIRISEGDLTCYAEEAMIELVEGEEFYCYMIVAWL